MAYEVKGGSLTLFKNDKKTKPNHPDYTGNGKQLDGTEVWVSAWVKDGQKGEFFSISLQKKEPKESLKQPTSHKVTTNGAPFDDEIPF